MFAGVAAAILRSCTSRLRCSTTTFCTAPLLHHSQHSFYSTAGTPLDGGSTPSGAGAGTNPGPPPIRVSLTEFAGRGVFATRRIGAGELIHTANPLVAHPSPSLIHDVCYYCLRGLGGCCNATFLASDCGFYRFCGEICREQAKAFYEVERRANWSAFDDYCKTKGLKYPFLVKRFACMVIAGVTSADSMDILQPACLSSEMIVQMEKGFELLKFAFQKAQIIDQVTFLTKQWYAGVLARIRINVFRIELAMIPYEDILAAAAASVVAEAAVGTAVYVLPSFYNHDCDPNAHIIWIDNADAKLKALRDIEAGEEICICYIDTSMDHNARQKVLFEGFGFQCHCTRCMSDD